MARAEIPEVLAFVDQARRFCDFVEKANELAMTERLSAARQRLLDLYEAGVGLPHVEPPEGIDAGPNPSRPKLSAFENFEIYWQIFDPYENSESVAGSITDDLLDVYGDLMRGLTLWDGDELSKIAAIWEWRFHFDIHWGQHAVNALRALHNACRTN